MENIFSSLASSRIFRLLLAVLYCFFLVFTAIIGVYVITYFLFIFIFLMIASSLGKFKIIEKIMALPKWQKIVFIFAVAFILRAVMLFQTQVITVDLERYLARSQNMLDGKLPYRDFYGGNKPPLYQFMLYLMGYFLTPEAVQFRAVFSVFDALIPLVLFIICIDRYNERFAIIASLTYALFPVGIICMGLSGHYDSVVVLFTLISIWMLFKNKPNISGLSLGISFALKLYPIVLLPFFLTKINSLKDRILYVVIFSIPTIISFGFLYLLSPSAFFKYLSEESEWIGVTSIPITLEMLIGSNQLLGVKLSWIVLGIFGILLLLLFFHWISPRRHDYLIKWFKIIIVVFIVHYGFYILFGILYYDSPLYLALLVPTIFIIFALVIFQKFMPKLVPESLSDPNSEDLMVVSTFALILFIMALPSYAPWYFIWFFPFLLMIKTQKIRFWLLWIFPWHGLGENMSLLPGAPKVN